MRTLDKIQPLMMGSILASLAMAVMPLYTLWFGTRQDPFSYTLSMMGNRFDQMKDFQIWGIYTGLVITVYILQLFRGAGYFDPRARRYLILSGSFLVLTVITPAVEEVNALTHKLHFVFAVLFVGMLTLSRYFFLRYLKIRDGRLSRAFLFSYAGVLLGGLLLVLFVGPNAVFEIFFFLAMAIYLLALNNRVKALEMKTIDIN